MTLNVTQVRMDFEPYCCDNEFWLEGPPPESNRWSGTWNYSGFVGWESGSFVAEKILAGQPP